MRVVHNKGITTDRIIAVLAILAAVAVGVMSWRQQSYFTTKAASEERRASINTQIADIRSRLSVVEQWQKDHEGR